MPKINHQIGGNIAYVILCMIHMYAYVSREDKEELLENNYRQTMKRDREDPERGDDYVSKAWTKFFAEKKQV